MIRRVLLLVVCGLLLVPAAGQADPVPGKQDKMVAQLVCEYLKRGHLSRPEIGDDMSKRLFQRFFKDLDPTKVYFLQSDLDEFKKYETELDDRLLEGNLDFAYEVFQRFLKRVAEGTKLAEEQIAAQHDFAAKETISTDYDHLAWPKDDAERRERWRKRVKFDLLLQRLGQKPLPDAEARTKIRERYQALAKLWKQFDNYDLMEIYLTALTASADPHSQYMSPKTLDDFETSMRLNLEGIGALLRSENGYTIVVEITPGGPASQDGRLKANDKIIGVSQGDSKFTDVVDMKLRDVVRLIRGPSKTKVELKVLPAGKLEPVVYDYTRAKIELKSQEARAEIVEDGKKPDGKPFKIGVIDLPSFYVDMSAVRSGKNTYKSATEDVRKILNDFNAKGVDGVVLDLRHNGGGALTEALSLTGLFIDQGPVVQVKGFQGRVQRHDDPEKGTIYSGPLMVLVSRMSASASEILAGALQDYGRALVVGDAATHGKGTVQTVIDLGEQLRGEQKLGALKLTIQQFYRVNGDSTQSKGVASDVVLPSLTEELASQEKDLEHALKFDHVKPTKHEELGLVTPDVKATLQARSAERVKQSAEYAKLLKQIAQAHERKERKMVSLNEAELREQYTKEEADKADGKLEDDPDADAAPKTGGAYKFKRTYINNEVLNVMEDFLQGKKLAQAR